MVRAVIILMCLAAISCAVGGASAADFRGPGIYAGINSGYMDYESQFYVWEKTEWALSFTIGGFAELEFTKMLSLQSGLRYAHVKNHIVFDRRYATGSGEISLDYLNIPVLGKARFGGGPRLFFIAGPEVGFLLHGESSVTQDSQSFHDDVTDALERINVSLDAGIGVEFDVGARVVFVRAQYCYGLSDVGESGEWYSDWETREVVVTTGMLF